MSISLGSFGISLTELVKGYAVFANGGRKISLKTITSVKDRNGNIYQIDDEMKSATTVENTSKAPVDQTVESSNPWLQSLSGDKVYDARLAYVMTKLLEGVILYGTGGGAKGVSTNIAGKTGTTNNFVDALFVGYSSNIVAGSWVGFDNNLPLGYGETGGRTALPVWKDYMEAAIPKYGAPDFVAPEGIVNIMINKDTGKPLKSGETNGFMETYAEGMDPWSSGIGVDESTVDPETKPQVLEDDDYYMNQ
jgi:penicillin-binding protein 1A